MFARKLTVLSLVLVLGFAPALSYAKDNSNRKEKGENSDRSERVEIGDDHDDRSNEDDNDKEKQRGKNKNKSEKKNGLCRVAFGHLIAPGFIKNWGEVNRSSLWNCFLPFGINASFSGTASTTDSVAPIISSVAAKPNTIKATITWLTNEKSDSTIFWGTSLGVNVNSSSTATVTRNERVKEHKIVLENLAASTTYYFVVRSKDPSGNTSTSGEGTFATKLVSPDTSAPVISSVALIVGTSTANISWHTNENATSKVYYGTSSGLDVNATSTTFLENTTPKQNHLISLSSLATSTLYYFAAESRDASGNRTVTPVFSASTTN